MEVLLTGGTGVLGSVVAEYLAPTTELTCLTRRRPLQQPHVRQVRGDLDEPDLGMDARHLADVVARTDVIAHCGAMTAFSSGAEDSHAVNVEGTDRILDLASRANARLVHVSTAFVSRLGEFGDAGSPDVRSPASYLRSKVAAEALVMGSGLETVIARPSVLIGDSRTGAIGQFQGWHAVCGAIITGRMPFLPAAGDSLVDYVPVDLAARVIADLVLHGSDRPAWWLTAGEEAMTLRQCVDLSLAVAAERGLSPHPPRLLAREVVERLFLPALAAEAPPALRRQMYEGVELMRLFGSAQPLSSSWPGSPSATAVTNAELEAHARTSMRYWCDKRGLAERTHVA